MERWLWGGPVVGGRRPRWALALLLPGLLLACSGGERVPSDMAAHPLIGRWTTDDVIVFYDATGRSLEARTFRIRAEDWADVLGLEPREVSFAADGTYWSEQRGVAGNLVERTSGRWATSESRLTLIQIAPNNAELNYHYEVEGARLTFESQVDWDSDGAEDDFYVSRGRRANTEQD